MLSAWLVKSSAHASCHSSIQRRIAPSPRRSWLSVNVVTGRNTMSAEKNLNHPSTSRPFYASYERRTSSARSGGAASSAIGPFLSEAFGGSTGLVDVPPSDHTRDHAVHPFVDQRPPFCNDAGATSRTALLAIDGIDDAVTQIDDS